METAEPNSTTRPFDEDGRILEFEAVRGGAAGAKLRLTCSHELQFDEVPAELQAHGNASRTHAVVILPQYATNNIEPPGARFECWDFLALKDLRAFHNWLETTFTVRNDAEFVLSGGDRSLELCFRHEWVQSKFKSSVVGRFAEPSLQRDNWNAHWKWVTEEPRGDFAFACEFAFFFDSECLRPAGLELGEYLHRQGA